MSVWNQPKTREQIRIAMENALNAHPTLSGLFDTKNLAPMPTEFAGSRRPDDRTALVIYRAWLLETALLKPLGIADRFALYTWRQNDTVRILNSDHDAEIVGEVEELTMRRENAPPGVVGAVSLGILL